MSMTLGPVPIPPLCVAARAGDLAACRALLADGAPLVARSPVGWSALHEAAWADADEVVRLLIAAGMEVDGRTLDGLTPAMIAAGRGAAGALAALCAHHATLGLRSMDGRTALESALENGFLTIGLDLVAAGAPLDTAHASLVLRCALQDAGRRVYQMEPVGEQAIREGEWLWLTRSPLPSSPDVLAPLRSVIETSTRRSILLRGRVRFAQIDPIPQEAVRSRMPSRAWRVRRGWTELVAEAIYGERPADEVDALGFLPILDAIRFGAPKAVQVLLARGARARRRPHYGLMRGATLLHNAAEEGTPRTVRALVEGGADVNAPSASSWTPLMVAASKGHLAAVHELLRAGADMEARNAQGQTAMAIAQLRRQVKVARALLVAGNVPLAADEGTAGPAAGRVDRGPADAVKTATADAPVSEAAAVSESVVSLSSRAGPPDEPEPS